MESILLALDYASSQAPQQHADLILGLPNNGKITADPEDLIATIEGVYGMTLDEIIVTVKQKIDAEMAYEQSVLDVHRIEHDNRKRINEYLEQASRFMEAEQVRLDALSLHAQYQQSLADSLCLKLELMLREREASYYTTSRVTELLQERRSMLEREAALDAQIQEKEARLADYVALGPEVADLAIRYQMLKEALTK